VELLLTSLTEKYLLALKCLLAASSLGPEHSKVHEQKIRFKQAITSELESVPAKSAEVIKSEFTLLPESADLTQYNDEYLTKHKDCARRTVAALKVRKLLSPDKATDCEKSIAGVIELPNITVEEATEALDLLKSWNSSEAESLRAAAASKWPHATVFASSK
jgi:hypothetical protein